MAESRNIAKVSDANKFLYKSLLESFFNSVKKNDAKIVEAFLEEGVDIHAVDKQGDSALHIAVSNGCTEVVALLLARGANANTVDRFGRTLLRLAVMSGNSKIIALIISAGANVNLSFEGGGETALHVAVREGQAEIAIALINAGADVNASYVNGMTPLKEAALRNYIDIVRALCDAGAEVNLTGGVSKATALYWAAYEGNTEAVKILLDHHADMTIADRKGLTPLHVAVSNGHAETTTLLLAACTQVQLRSYGAIVFESVALAQNGQLLKKLVPKGFNVNFVNDEGGTLLHVAAERGRHYAVKMLLDCGADVNIADSKGRTALHYAGYGGNVEVIKALLSAGADVNACDVDGKHPLHFAVVACGAEAVVTLLMAGAQVDARRHDGATALEVACFASRFEIMTILINAGANVEWLCQVGESERNKIQSVQKQISARNELLGYVQGLRKGYLTFFSKLPEDMFEHVLAPKITENPCYQPKS